MFLYIITCMFLSLILFLIGILGFVLNRKNIILIIMKKEIIIKIISILIKIGLCFICKYSISNFFYNKHIININLLDNSIILEVNLGIFLITLCLLYLALCLWICYNSNNLVSYFKALAFFIFKALYFFLELNISASGLSLILYNNPTESINLLLRSEYYNRFPLEIKRIILSNLVIEAHRSWIDAGTGQTFYVTKWQGSDTIDSNLPIFHLVDWRLFFN